MSRRSIVAVRASLNLCCSPSSCRNCGRASLDQGRPFCVRDRTDRIARRPILVTGLDHLATKILLPLFLVALLGIGCATNPDVPGRGPGRAHYDRGVAFYAKGDYQRAIESDRCALRIGGGLCEGRVLPKGDSGARASARTTESVRGSALQPGCCLPSPGEILRGRSSLWNRAPARSWAGGRHFLAGPGVRAVGPPGLRKRLLP